MYVSVRVGYLQTGIGSIEKEARAALAAFCNALNYTTSYFGWPTAEIDRLEAQIDEGMPTFFR